MTSFALETYRFAGDGRFPNSPLPVLVYRGAVAASAAPMIAHFAQHGWGRAWRNGIYRFHHFHSLVHEVLGIAAGSARVRLGGPDGRPVAVDAGDVVVIPAGLAHCNEGQSADLLVVGAYPEDGSWDVQRGDPHTYAACRQVIASVPVPGRDPVTGEPIAAWSI